MRGFVFLLLLAGASPAEDLVPAGRKAVMETLVRYSRALWNKDFPAYQAVTEPDASLGPPHFSLWQAAHVKERSFDGEETLHCTLAPHTFRYLSPDTLLVDGRFGHVDSTNHRLLGETGQFLAVMRKRPDGWKVAAMRLAGGPEMPPSAPPLSSAPIERPSGWVSLFDGRSFQGWQASGGGPIPDYWQAGGGVLKALPTQAIMPISIRTARQYTNFELDLEWKMTPGGNSGVKYRILRALPISGGWYDVGSEYQLVDDSGDRAKTTPPDGVSGALYDLLPPARLAARKPGEWNQSRLIVRNRHISHWLNGEAVLEYEVDHDFASPLLLQNHGTEVWFRNIRIHPL